MADNYKLTFNKDAWNDLVKDVINTDGIARMQRVADACNDELGPGADGFKVSIEGDDPLQKHDYSATVITSDPESMRKNAKDNTLVKNFHLAGGN